MDDIDDWFRAHHAYHEAVRQYNDRVRFIRSKEDEMDEACVFNADAEYRLMNKAQRAAFSADEALYHSLLEKYLSSEWLRTGVAPWR